VDGGFPGLPLLGEARTAFPRSGTPGWQRDDTRQWRGGEFAKADHHGNGIRRRRYSFTSRFSGRARAYRARGGPDRLQALNRGVDGDQGGVGTRGFCGGGELFGQVVEAGIDDTGPRARDGEKERARAECLGCGVRKSVSGLSAVRKVGLSSGPALSASLARAERLVSGPRGWVLAAGPN
jgi:hypothetical protein